MAFEGLFQGGFQEGMSERRRFDQDKKTQDAAGERDEKRLALSERELGLRAVDSARAASQFGQRLAFDKETAAKGHGLDEKRLSIQERSALLAQRQQEFSEKQAVSQRVDAQIGSLMGVVKETTTELKATGVPPEKIAKAVESLQAQIERLSQYSDQDPNIYKSQIASLIAAPSPQQLASAQGQVQAAQALGQATALHSVGVSPNSALQTAGIKGINEPVETLTFQMPDGTVKSVLSTDRDGVLEIVKQGGAAVKLSVQAADISGVSASVQSKKSVSESQEAVRQTQANIEELEKTVEAFEKNPEAAGVMGVLIEKLGGLAAQLPGGKEVVGALGIDRKAVAKARTQAVASIGQIIRLVSQDNSRFSEGDRKLAESASKALKPEAGNDEVTASLDTLMDIMKRAQMKDIDKLRVASKIGIDDLETPVGINKLGKVLTDNGMTREQASDAIVNLRTRFDLGVRK